MTKYPFRHPVLRFTQQFLDSFLPVFFPAPKKFVSSENMKVLVIKQDHIGDLFLNQIAFSALNKTHETHYVINPYCKNLATKILPQQKVYCINHFMHDRTSSNIIFRLLGLFRTMLDFKRLLLRNSYDVILLARTGPGNGVFWCRLFSRTPIIGFEVGGFKKLLSLNLEVPKGRHEVEKQTELLKCIGFKDVSKDYFDGYRLNKIKNLTILAPNSGDMRREFPPNHWVDVLHKFEVSDVLIIGTRLNREIERSLNENKVKVNNLSKKTTFSEAFDLVSKAERVFCVESFPADSWTVSGRDPCFL